AGPRGHARGDPGSGRPDHGCHRRDRGGVARRERATGTVRPGEGWRQGDRQSRKTDPEEEGQHLMSKVAVIGAGSWGTAFSIVLADAGNDVTVWARRPELASAISKEHENADYLPGIRLPDNIDATADIARAMEGAEVVVFATPSQTFRDNL